MQPLRIEWNLEGLLAKPNVLTHRQSGTIDEMLRVTSRVWGAVVGWPEGEVGNKIDRLAINLVQRPRPLLGGALAEVSEEALVVPFSTGAFAFMPSQGTIQLDVIDLRRLVDALEFDQLCATIQHEVAHTLGFGIFWEKNGLIDNSNPDDPLFVGENAMREYAKLIGTDAPQPVPLENKGSPQRRLRHWRYSVFYAHDKADDQSELMAPDVAPQNVRLSRLTVAALADMGYEVNLDNAEPFRIPNQ